MTHNTDPSLAYKMSQAEFKGAVLQSLEDIKEDIRELKGMSSGNSSQITNLKVTLEGKASKNDIHGLQDQINNIKLISSVVGGATSLVVTIAALLVGKPMQH